MPKKEGMSTVFIILFLTVLSILGFLAISQFSRNSNDYKKKDTTIQTQNTATQEELAPTDNLKESTTPDPVKELSGKAEPVDIATAYIVALQNNDFEAAKKLGLFVTDEEWQMSTTLRTPFQGNSTFYFGSTETSISLSGEKKIKYTGFLTTENGEKKEFTILP